MAIRPAFSPPPVGIACNECIAYIACMNQLTIRGVDDEMKRQLRVRAAENGRSMEEEVRQILRHALGLPSPEEEHSRKLRELIAANRRGG
jgi:plasmid stability protein